MAKANATRTLRALAVLLAVSPLGRGAAAAEDSCREWTLEHRRWTVEALRGYLEGAPQPELDESLFEILQREAYLTSCDLAMERAREEFVGWRLVDRVPDEYGSAVAESVLERAGFDLGLESLLARPSPPSAGAGGDLVPRRARGRRDGAR